MQDPWIERLSEYLDEELDRSERETLEAHLTRCSACSSAVKDLKAVRERARSLSDAPVPAELWSRIESGIASGRIRSIPADPVTSGRPGGSGRGRGGRSRWGGQFSFSLPELIAACLGIAILSGGAVFALVKHQAGIAPPAQTSVSIQPTVFNCCRRSF